MQHMLVALKYEEASSYSILIFLSSLFGCPLSWMPGTVASLSPLHNPDSNDEQEWKVAYVTASFQRIWDHIHIGAAAALHYMQLQ